MSEQSSPAQPAGPEGVPPEAFHRIYEGDAPWDIGGPQPRVLELIEAGVLEGEILDLGCGTGDNAIGLVSAGHRVWGIDMVPEAIEKARHKSAGLEPGMATFDVGDALRLDLGRTFDTILDSGVFHSFSDDDRPLYTGVLATHLRVEGLLHILCLSEHQAGGGPRRVSKRELHELFAAPRWQVQSIVPSVYDTASGSMQAWHATVRRSS